MENNRNFFITIALSVLILSLWQVFLHELPHSEAQREAARIEEQRIAEQKKATEAASPGGSRNAGAAARRHSQCTQRTGNRRHDAAGREQALASTKRVRIDTPSLEGSINLTGARLDDLKLKHYTLTVDKNSPEIELLNPAALPTGYYAEIGFVGSDKTGTVPGPETVWTVDGNATLTPATPVTLSFTNDKGLTFKRTFSVDSDYMFTVSDTVQNSGVSRRHPVELRPRHALRQACRCQHLCAA